MSKTTNPAEPTPDAEKFKPSNVAKAGPDKGRNERDMKDTARGSEGDTRRASGMPR